MTTFNTRSPRQSISNCDYRGSYTQHLTIKQFEMITSLANQLDVDLEALWMAWFDDDYEVGNWRSISVNAASEIISHSMQILKVERALLRKIQRTEQQQHDYEMGWEV